MASRIIKRQQGYPLEIEAQYLRAIDSILSQIDRHALDAVRQHRLEEKEARQDSLKSILESFRDLHINFERHPAVQKFAKTTENIIKSAHNFSSKLTKIAWSQKLAKGLEKLGIGTVNPPTETFKLPALSAEHLKPIVAQNVALIQQQSKEYLAKVEQTIVNAIAEGKSQKDLAADLAEKTKAIKSKAKFWAADQLGKAFSDMNRANQRAAGFNEYIWRTQLDGRVRDRHAEFEGKKYSYDNPPLSETEPIRPINPGDDYLCRCYAEPVFEDTPADPPDVRLKNLLKIERKKAEME